MKTIVLHDIYKVGLKQAEGKFIAPQDADCWRMIFKDSRGIQHGFLCHDDIGGVIEEYPEVFENYLATLEYDEFAIFDQQWFEEVMYNLEDYVMEMLLSRR